MAKKRETAAKVDEVEEGELTEDLQGLYTGEELEPALERLFAEAGGGPEGVVTVYINKIRAEDGKEPRVWSGKPIDFDLMATAKRFGSGDYKVRIYVPSKRGNPRVLSTFTESIELSAEEDAKLLAIRRGEFVTAPAQAAFNPADLPRMIADSIRTMLPAPTPVADPFAQMAQVAQIMKTLMPSVPVASTGNPLKESLETARALIELSGGIGKGNPPVDGDGKIDAGGHALTRGIDLVTRLFEKGMEKPAQPQISAMPGQIVEQQPNQQENSEAEEYSLNMLKLQLATACRMAAKNENPEPIAEMVYGEMPDEMLDTLALDPQWFAIICHAESNCAKYQPWFTKLRDCIVNLAVADGIYKSENGTLQLVPESDTVIDSNSTVAGGNGADHSGNVPAGTGKTV